MHQKTYRTRFFRDWFFNPILWVIFIFALPIITFVPLAITTNETNKPFWDVFWTPSQELYPSPFIGTLPAGIEMLVVAAAIWFLIVIFLWALSTIIDKVVLTDEFIQYYGQRVKLSDVKRISIGEAGVSALTKIYPSAPQPHELPQAVLKGKTKFDLPRWLMNTDFFENLKKLAPEIKVTLPKPRPYLFSLAIFYLLIFIGIVLGFVGFFYWLGWFNNFSLTRLGTFNFVEFFNNHPFLEKVAIGIGGSMGLLTSLSLSLSLFLSYDKYWRKVFFKILITVGLLHLPGWLLYYFGILK